MTFGSLFSGIGGLDLGFERAGFTPLWFCEIEPYPRSILKKHWPEVPCYEDVTILSYTMRIGCGEESRAQQRTERISENGEAKRIERPDVLIGGFPCQDISMAGKGAGLDGARSGLWWEFHRLIGEFRPRYAVMENVAALVVRGLPEVLGSLSEIGYDAEWTIVSAASVGAPHIRERIFIVAYPAQQRDSSSGDNGCSGEHCEPTGQLGRGGIRAGREASSEWWSAEPNVGRVANGVPRRVDRLKGLGNAVVPQVAEYIALCVRAHAERAEV